MLHVRHSCRRPGDHNVPNSIISAIVIWSHRVTCFSQQIASKQPNSIALHVHVRSIITFRWSPVYIQVLDQLVSTWAECTRAAWQQKGTMWTVSTRLLKHNEASQIRLIIMLIFLRCLDLEIWQFLYLQRWQNWLHVHTLSLSYAHGVTTCCMSNRQGPTPIIKDYKTCCDSPPWPLPQGLPFHSP